jgi:Domain of unknown function (DUF4279)
MTDAYRYAVSLRIRHPSIDPAEISAVLRLNPSRCLQAGESRATPIGTSLHGDWRESYWTSGDVAKGAWPDIASADALNRLLDQLSEHHDFFHRIRAEGGRTEFFVGWYFLGNSGDVFHYDLLARMADLKIDLSLDVYPPDQPQKNI